MNSMGISTDPALLDVELPHTLIESPSVSTFLPDEEASICPLLSNTNGTSTPLTFSHPLTPCVDNDSNNSANLCNEDAKAGDTSSSGSSSGIGMDAPETAATTLFNKHAYQHLQVNNGVNQESNGHGPNGNLTITKDTPSFVSWNWPLIRKCTFFAFMSSLLGMVVLVIAMIISLPRTCNPITDWYRGGVFYEIFPASFQDSNNDGIGDLRGIFHRVDYLSSLGVAAVRLNSVFPSQNYPEDFENITSLTDIAKPLGSTADLLQLANILHLQNMSLIIDLPIKSYIKELEKNHVPTNQVNVLITDLHLNKTTEPAKPIGSENLITSAIRKWIALGVDGFYIKGLEDFVDNINFLKYLSEWKNTIGSNRVLIIDEQILNRLDDSKQVAALAHIDLVDVFLDVLNGTKHMEERIKTVLSGRFAPTKRNAWIHWSIGGIDKQRLTHRLGNPNTNITLSATLMQLMLPGTPSIFYGDEIALEGTTDPRNEHSETKHLHHLSAMQWSNRTKQFTNREILPWLPQHDVVLSSFENFEITRNMIRLRNRSPSIYKNSICKSDTSTLSLPNTQIRHSHDDILVVERVYPRRNSFVSVSNFGTKLVTMDMTSLYYSGASMLQSAQDKVYFKYFHIGPMETIVVKLDK